jgi:hypothetical protein
MLQFLFSDYHPYWFGFEAQLNRNPRSPLLPQNRQVLQSEASVNILVIFTDTVFVIIQFRRFYCQYASIPTQIRNVPPLEFRLEQYVIKKIDERDLENQPLSTMRNLSSSSSSLSLPSSSDSSTRAALRARISAFS